MCMIDDNSDGYGVIFTTQKRKARRSHTCNECRRTIERGEHYFYGSGVHDYVWHAKTCAHCDAASSWLMKTCGGWIHESLLEDLEEHWRENTRYRSTWLRDVLHGIRAQWRQDGQLLEVPEFFGEEQAKELMVRLIRDDTGTGQHVNR